MLYDDELKDLDGVLGDDEPEEDEDMDDELADDEVSEDEEEETF